MTGLADILGMSGQERRAWLDSVSSGLERFIPPNLRPAASMAAQMNPIQGMSDSMQQFGVAADPTQPADVRRRAAIGSGVEGLLAVTPAALAARGYLTPAQGLMESVIGGSPTTRQIGDDVGRFVADEAGNIRLWHGSPHDFDRFSMDKIGTGEGAQAYGHGLYFAENEGVAREYRDALSARAAPNDARGNAFDLVQRMGGDVEGTVDILRDAIDSVVSPNTEKFLRDTLRHIEDGTFADYERPLGRLYEVNINANPEDFLDWDKPLSEQPQSVRDFANARWQQVFGRNPDPTIEGEYIAKMASPQHGIDGREWLDTGPAADQARRLREAGITGIKYFDAMSRGAGEGSRNYVLFDDRLVDILSKDGVRTPEGRAADVLGLLGSGRAADVTDEMLDMGDSVQNARLNEYLFNNYDLPMDESSREMRALGQGYDISRPMYHGTDTDFTSVNTDMGTGERYRTGLYSSDNPDVAASYAPNRDRGMIVPLLSRVSGKGLTVDAQGANWNRIDASSPVSSGGASSGLFSDIYDEPNAYMFFNNMYDDLNGLRELSTNAMARQRRFEGDPSITFENVIDRGPYSLTSDQAVSASKPSRVNVDFYPSYLRSRFARFDPRLSHLRNLSAGLGSVGLLGAMNQENLDQETRNYLAGGA